MSQTFWREPDSIAAGDTLSFTKKLGNYPAGQGWSITYEMRGGAQAIEFKTTASGDDHVANVAPATTATWLSGEYVLVGYVGNGVDRFQIYEGQLVVEENRQGAAGDVPEKTFAQKQIEILEQTISTLNAAALKASRSGDAMFQYTELEEARKEWGYWKEVRANEIKVQRSREGKPTGNKIRPSMRIVGAGVSFGVSPFGNRP